MREKGWRRNEERRGGISLTAAVAGIALLLGACNDRVTQPSPATSLVQVVPQDGATGVAPNSSLMLEFRGMMDMGMEQYIDLHQGSVTGPVSDDGGVHAGQEVDAMGPGWRDADGHLGVAFSFTTS